MFVQRSVDSAARLDDQVTNGADFISQLANDALFRLHGRLTIASRRGHHGSCAGLLVRMLSLEASCTSSRETKLSYFIQSVKHDFGTLQALKIQLGDSAI